MIPPGSTIGIIGGGQLGRMLSTAAASSSARQASMAAGIGVNDAIVSASRIGPNSRTSPVVSWWACSRRRFVARLCTFAIRRSVRNIRCDLTHMAQPFIARPRSS